MPTSNGRSVARIIFNALGSVCVGLGILGIFLPVLPTTPFLLLAAACYMKGSRRFYNWLINHRLLGRYIRYYREGRGIPIRSKIISVVFIWITIGFSVGFVVPILALKILLAAIALSVSIFILSRKTLKE